MKKDADLRARLVAAYRRLDASGVNQGTSGNLSVRLGADRFLVSPSGIGSASLVPEDIPLTRFDGRWTGPRRPSSEWRIHRDILSARPEVGAVVHAHPRHAAALACLGREIPAFHYMVAVAGGDSVRCAPYRTFGTQALSDVALAALEGRRVCLLANHGILALHATIEGAVTLAIEVETLAAMYISALSVGEPNLLTADEMARVGAMFADYEAGKLADGELRGEGH
ncbi:MAG TPA: class II aldolase/adducin family protein [Alphaproteobacteria bacterium]|nr:class II aldolase/adducin family protein [Alphaproteobacteria bacterium]